MRLTRLAAGLDAVKRAETIVITRHDRLAHSRTSAAASRHRPRDRRWRRPTPSALRLTENVLLVGRQSWRQQSVSLPN